MTNWMTVRSLSGLRGRVQRLKARGTRVTVDGIFMRDLSGWVVDGTGAPARIRIEINGELISECVADRFRPDLVEAGWGDGRWGFAATLPKGFSFRVGDQIVVRAAQSKWKAKLKISRSHLELTVGEAQWTSSNSIRGWVYRPWAPGQDNDVSLLADGEVVDRVRCNEFRTGMPNVGSGSAGFTFSEVPRDAVLRVRCEQTGWSVPLAGRDRPAVAGDSSTPSYVGAVNQALGEENQRLRALVVSLQTDLQEQRKAAGTASDQTRPRQ